MVFGIFYYSIACKENFFKKLKSSFVHHLHCHLKHCSSGFKMDMQRFRCCIKLMNKYSFLLLFCLIDELKILLKKESYYIKTREKPHTHKLWGGCGGEEEALGILFLHHNTKGEGPGRGSQATTKF